MDWQQKDELKIVAQLRWNWSQFCTWIIQVQNSNDHERHETFEWTRRRERIPKIWKMGKGKDFPNNKGGRKEAKVHEKRSRVDSLQKGKEEEWKKGGTITEERKEFPPRLRIRIRKGSEFIPRWWIQIQYLKLISNLEKSMIKDSQNDLFYFLLFFSSENIGLSAV